jgi:hypothetical protein
MSAFPVTRSMIFSQLVPHRFSMDACATKVKDSL